MSNNVITGRYEYASNSTASPIVIYNGMDRFANQTRTCQCDTPLAMTRPIVSMGRLSISCTSWCPFCGITQCVSGDLTVLPTLAPDDVWRLDADKIYGFITSLNAFRYLPRDAESNEFAWTFPQMYGDGTFSMNIFNIVIGRGLTVRAPEAYILRDECLSAFDTKLLKEFDELGSLGLIFPKEPAYANA